jgi:hypothetical protein
MTTLGIKSIKFSILSIFGGHPPPPPPDSDAFCGQFAQDFLASADTPFKTNQVGQAISGLGGLTSGV